jgi:hypothetical protein
MENVSFPEDIRVMVHSETLDLDPGLVGNNNGVSGLVVSRSYHHVTGTPMFHVDFGGSIGIRSVRVSDSVVDVDTSFTDTHRTLFPAQEDPIVDMVGSLEEPAEGDSDDDRDWEGGWEDFLSADAASETASDSPELSYVEDPLKELGLYNYKEDVSTWSFERLFADDQWQDQSITLEQNTQNFCGPTPGPTTAVASRPTDYFLRYWPPHILDRIVEETNR